MKKALKEIVKWSPFKTYDQIIEECDESNTSWIVRYIRALVYGFLKGFIISTAVISVVEWILKSFRKQ